MDKNNNAISQQELNPETTLWHETYKIIKVLGQGGFGITYLAEDVSLGREVCIKEFFPKEYCGRDDTSHLTVSSKSAVELINRMKEKFVKEARNIVRFNHPNIIKVYSAFEENNTAYYVMDYVKGESLYEIVKDKGPLAPLVAINYISQIGSALDYIHRHKLNHLDVKPANIMISSGDNRPILIDFGLAKQYDTAGNQTSTTPVGISHGYAPIEQYKAGGVSSFSPQSDLYSLAATLYYILTGIVPPDAASLASEPLDFPPYFPSQYIPAIKRAMSTSRGARHESIKSFLAELDTHTTGSSPYADSEATRLVVAAPDGSLRPQSQAPQIVNTPYESSVESPKQKNPWMMPALIVVGAILIAVLLLIVFLRDGKGSDREMIISEASPSTEVMGDAPAYSGESVEELTVSEPTVSKLKLSVNDAPHLAPQGGGKWHYNASNLIDGSKKTAWVCDARLYNDGTGIDLLRFSLNAEKIDHIKLTNGYVKDPNSFRNNARAGSVYISRVPWDQATTSDIIYAGSLSGSMSPQTLPVAPGYDNSRPTNTIYVKFGPDVVHGQKWPNDFAITEFQVFGY